MVTKHIINRESINNKTFVLIEEDESFLTNDNILECYTKDFKVQLEIKILWMKFYITIKTFIPDYVLSYDDIQFAKNEAKELFNNIINPYKYNG